MQTWVFHRCLGCIWSSSVDTFCSLNHCGSVWHCSWWTSGRWFLRCWAWTWPVSLFLTMKSSNVLKDWSIHTSITLSPVPASKMWPQGKMDTHRATYYFFIEHHISWGRWRWEIGQSSQFHKFHKPLKFDQCVNIVYFDDRARIDHGPKRISKVPALGKCLALKTPIILFASTLGPRWISLDCVSRMGNDGRELTIMGFLLWVRSSTTQFNSHNNHVEKLYCFYFTASLGLERWSWLPTYDCS